VPISRWEPDGTQPPPPPRVWDDATAGLVTGPFYVRDKEAVRVKVEKPDVPDVDLDEVRRAVDAVLSDEVDTAVTPAPRRTPPPAPPARVTPGMVDPNPRPGWPRSPSVRQLAGLRRPAERIPPPKWAPRRKSGSSAGGIGAIIVVLGVLIWIIVSIISGLLETISGIFN
jgi:hypothetical protein